MQLDECFVRIKEGEWFCKAPCCVEGPTGRVTFTPGVVYRRGRLHMGVDVAALLEDWKQTGALPPNFTAA